MTELPAHCEVLVIGGGAAGLCAAIAARRRGAEVVMADHAAAQWRGGNTRHARNFRVVHDAPDDYAPGSYPVDAFCADVARVAPDGDAALTRQLGENSATIVRWLQEQGVRMQRRGRGTMPWSQRTVFFAGGGKAAADTLYATAQQIGVRIVHDAEACGLQVEDNQVKAVELIYRGQRTTILATVVIAGCGGHQANHDWLRDSFGPAADAIHVRGIDTVRGRLLRAMMDSGAATVGDEARGHIVAVDARGPEVDGGIVTRLECIPYGIVVDRDGRRFADEGGDTKRTHYARWGERLLAAPCQLAYAILDDDGIHRANPTAFPPIRADSVDELARELGLDPQTLVTTVDDYNRAIVTADPSSPAAWRTSGLSPDKTSQAWPIARQPFAAFPLRPGITFTHFGVAVDASLRVRRQDGARFDNLLAAGMVMAANVLPRGYLAGLGVTIGAAFGRLAGEEAALHVGR